jgi:hypothetical protein
MKVKGLDEKGNVAVILCLAFTVLLGFTAFVIDIGLVYAERVKLSNALDAAVLAAAQELPNNRIRAKEVAEEYLLKNQVDIAEVVINISGDNKSIEIQGQRVVKHLFAPILGINNSTVEVENKGIIAPIKVVKGGIKPFAVEYFPYNYGDPIILKQGAGSGYHGNYGPVALGGSGASIFRLNALFGYEGTLSVGDYIDTETGNMVGATNDIKNYINSEQSSFENFEKNSIRVWTIPLVDTLQVDGRKSVLIIGFGEFFVDGVRNGGGSMEITGRFVRYVTKGEVDTELQDNGAYGVKLVK